MSLNKAEPCCHRESEEKSNSDKCENEAQLFITNLFILIVIAI